VRIVQVRIITPLILQQMASVPPGLYLFMILAFGVAFGGLGMFFVGALSVAALHAGHSPL
jgi:predicted PurR-regulated permease PerM